MSKKRKKRKITAEHLAKMQEGRKKAQTHRKRVAQLSDLEARLQNGERVANQPMKVTKSQRRRVGML